MDAGRSHGPKLGGIVPFSSCDYPGRLACVVFVSGCPWHCHYCHNPHLRVRNRQTGSIEWNDILRWLDTRNGLLDAIVFSGGEPLVERHLPTMMAHAKSRGLSIALHTGGAYPDRLSQCLPLIEWIGFDVKAPFSTYDRITRIPRSGEAAQRSLELMLASNVTFECRTTIHPALLDDADLIGIAQALADRGITELVLQPFRPDGCVSDRLLGMRTPDDYPGDALLGRLRDILRNVHVRWPT
ncbi:MULTISPECIES: anaerobic ribonucleoside-triphosphate reductase activating protein [Burkholderia]|uniref:anaerobic ribonucleoside-triphosphate reductase activating protein n=1 Tax=Burkholderia TaxID=32008 RepID=UPI001CF4AC9B|nr:MULTISPECIES: anaerobic ribonucleoside-triphosphate reductase activating protein [Burkholderia]MCA8037239.1 anaerobic ribonucleoside-triphosphate reductase activating protein [Burkholderia arboris]MDN7702652.1 anaerobic ribonucleoside-triphosphate reductase activating protein [Burkholderia sp. AU44665]